jgi:hypothetical protein
MWRFLLLMGTAIRALACECSMPSVCELIHRPTIFIGEVVAGGISSIREDPWRSNVKHVRFRVLENLRGLPAGTGTVDVELTPTHGLCAPIPYFPGRKYLFTSRFPGRVQTDGICPQGRDLEDAGEDVRVIREFLAGKMPINLHGQIAAARDNSMVDFLLTFGEAKPLGGVVISAGRGLKTYSAVSEADGRYTLALPSDGAYQVRAALRPYTAGPAGETTVAGGCVVLNFGLQIDNTISGRVWNHKGQPVTSAEVGLIDLDRRLSNSRYPREWFNRAVTGQAGANFLFKNVPIGRYLLVFNPRGPRPAGIMDQPFESTYYPLNANLDNAKVIEVKTSGVHLTAMDLVMGKPVSFRPVTVRVRFRDGKPMKTARANCAGLPRVAGEIPWIKTGMPDKDETFRFSAPTDRRLKIEVKDWFGRELKGVLSSTHEPGSAPVTKEFVVE